MYALSAGGCGFPSRRYGNRFAETSTGIFRAPVSSGVGIGRRRRVASGLGKILARGEGDGGWLSEARRESSATEGEEAMYDSRLWSAD